MKYVTERDREIYEEIRDVSSLKYLDRLPLTEERLVNIARNMSFKVVGLPKIAKVENTRLPSLVAAFYYMPYKHRTILTQEQYINYYQLLHREWLKKTFTSFELKGLEARLSRTYASVFRDLHFYYLIKNMNLFNSVEYKVKYDIEAKSDVIIETKKNNKYAVQLRNSTIRSDEYYKKKKFRDYKPLAFLEGTIDLPLKSKDAQKIATKGETLYLYSKDTVSHLFDIISRYEN